MRSLLRHTRILVSVSCLCAVAAAQPLTFDTADSIKNWTFGNGPEFPGATGKIEWEASSGRSKPGCLALHFSFAGGGNYVQASWPLPEKNDYRQVRLWLRKTTTNRITFRATDSGAQAFKKSLDYSSDDWQQVEVDLTHWNHWFGGPADGKVRLPMRTFAILVENTGSAKEGTVLIDDVEFTSAKPTGSSGTITSYVAWDPTSKVGWSARGGEDNTFTNGAWNYAFFGNSSPSIDTEFSLLGRPVSLKLFLQSDGSGHDVFVTIGSHFQSFRKLVGRLSENGPQHLDVPLADMKDWEHFGGENDGQVRLPLRVLEISLKRGNGPERGTIRLARIEAETVLPASQTIVVSPNVEFQAGNAFFRLEIRNLRKTSVRGNLVSDFRQGVWLDRQAQEATLEPAGMTSRTPTFSIPVHESTATEGVFWWVEDGRASDLVSIGMSTPPAEPGSITLDPASPFGVGLYLYRWNGHAQAKQHMNDLAALARRAGVKWTREEIDWHRTEPAPGTFDWSFYDDLVEVAHANGISIYGLLCYWSSFTRKDTPEGVEDYRRWVRQVVRHYKGKIKHWEIWNEPNIFFWSGPKELYFSLLAKAYDAVKAEDPEAQVLGCSTAGIDVDFIKRAMAAGAKFDALTIHPYRSHLDDLRFIQELRDAKKLVGGRPVWITEMGWPSDRFNGCTEWQQGSYVARVYLTSLASGAVANVSWYDFRDDGSDPYYNEFNFGLVRNDLRLKPAYRALATIADTLASLKVSGQIDLGPEAYAFRFSDGKRDVVAACAPQNGRLLAFRDEPEEAALILDTFGNKVQPARANRIQVVTLDAGMPAYIMGRVGFAFHPAGPPVKLSIDRPSACPGDLVAMRVEPALPVIIWHLPPDWTEPKHDPDGRYTLSIPADARPGEVEMEATVLWNNQPLRLPFKLSIAAAVIRV